MKQTVLKIKLWQHLADVPARCCKYQVWKLHQGNSFANEKKNEKNETE